MLEKRIPWGIDQHIDLEVLQGAKNDSEWERLKEYFETVPFFSFALLIAQTALENDVPLLHNDGDFDNIGRVIGELRQYK